MVFRMQRDSDRMNGSSFRCFECSWKKAREEKLGSEHLPKTGHGAAGRV